MDVWNKYCSNIFAFLTTTKLDKDGAQLKRNQFKNEDPNYNEEGKFTLLQHSE